MAEIHKVYSDVAETNQIYLQTHEKAVIDDNGNTLESKLGVVTEGVEALQEAYSALTQSDIVVVADHTAVSSPQANTIYREQGTTTYSDWMYYDGAWKEMAVYNNNIPSIENTSNNADLDIADEVGNVLVRFENGGIKTKNFDSELVGVEVNSLSNGDFAVNDENNNTIVLFKDGHIFTKNFHSQNVPTNIFTKYNGKRLSILGDSISTFGTPDQNNAIGTWTYPNNRCRYPQNNLLTDVKKCYWYLLMEMCGMEFGINESWAGSRVSNTQATDSGDLGPNRCMASTTRIGHLGNKGTPDVILVYGGTNDIGNSVTIGTFDKTNPINYTESQINALPVDTFASAYRTMLIKLMYYYPNAEIVCCLPNFTNTYYNVSDLDDYVEVIKEECDFFGVKYIDLRTSGMNVYNRMTYLPDGTHPNASGMQLLANKIYKQLIFI